MTLDSRYTPDEIPESGGRVTSGAGAAPPQGQHLGQSYADLDGGQGREVHFRPRRYQREDFGPVHPLVLISPVTGGQSGQECLLHDVSQNGVAFEWPVDQPVETGAIIEELTVSFDGHQVYTGQGRVGSVREVDGKRIVGAQFTDSLMNIRDVLHLRDVRSWSLGGAGGLGLGDRPWRVAGCDRFKSLVGDLRLLLDDTSTQLSRVEPSLPWSVVHGDQDSPARRALIDCIHNEFVTEFVRCSEDVDSALREAPSGAMAALKDYSNRQLQQYFMQAPCMHRALHKPLGYPGDYESMKVLYERPFAGPTLFAKAMTLAFVSTRPAQAVRARKDLMKERLSELLDGRRLERPLRVMSIAAGPAQEVYELLRDRQHLACPIEVVLFDQDEEALSYAYGRLKHLVDSRWPDRVRIIYLHDSIKRLLNDPDIFGGLGALDAIFCCGLFDYLEKPVAVTLCRNLFRSLGPQGTLYIGNMVPNNPGRWFMELHLDWFLLYRTRGEMANLARQAVTTAHIQILEESTGLNPFVSLTRV